MIFVVGGVGAGKRDFVARELGVAPGDVSHACVDDRPCVDGVHLIVRDLPHARARDAAGAVIPCGDDPSTTVVPDVAISHGSDPAALDDLFETLCAKRVVICDEVGCGVVPIDEGERAWREDVGRLCCRLAERADVVVRLVCGIPQVLRGSLGSTDNRGDQDNPGSRGSRGYQGGRGNQDGTPVKGVR